MIRFFKRQTRWTLLAILACMVICLPLFADTLPALHHSLPAFRLADINGKQRTLEEFRGRSVTLCFFCGCQVCQEAGKSWGQMQRTGVFESPGSHKRGKTSSTSRPSPITVIIYMGDKEATLAYAQGVGLDMSQTVLLPDADYKVTQSYQALPCPRFYVLDRQGRLGYVNNHADDDPQRANPAAILAHVVDALKQAERVDAPLVPQPTRSKQRSRPHQGRK